MSGFRVERLLGLRVQDLGFVGFKDVSGIGLRFPKTASIVDSVARLVYTQSVSPESILGGSGGLSK